MEPRFKSSFREFLQSVEVDFIVEGDCFIFPKQQVNIFLIHAHTPQWTNVPVAGEGDRLYLYEDRWWHCTELVKMRILARLAHFRSVFARKCKVVSGEEWRKMMKEGHPSDVEFLEKYHSYGGAKSKYKYALVYDNKIVAVATFSAPRPMVRRIANPFSNVPHNEMGTIRMLEHVHLDDRAYSLSDAVLVQSYEWVRYASLPDIRVVGGMGKLLHAFFNDIKSKGTAPIEVMTYSDNEWSAGDVYEKLGFTFVGEREPVAYFVNRVTYERLSERKLVQNVKKIEQATIPIQSFSDYFYKIKNMGSRKFLIQLPALPHQSSLCSDAE